MPNQDNLVTTPIELNIPVHLSNLLERLDMDDEETRETMEKVLLRFEKDLAESALQRVFAPVEASMRSRLDGIDPRLGWCSTPALISYYNNIELLNVETGPSYILRTLSSRGRDSDDVSLRLAKTVDEEYDEICEEATTLLDERMASVIPLFHRLDALLGRLASDTPSVQEYGSLRERLPAYCFDWDFRFDVSLSHDEPLRVGVVFQPSDVFVKEEFFLIGSFKESDLDNPLFSVTLASKVSRVFEDRLGQQVTRLSKKGLLG